MELQVEGLRHQAEPTGERAHVNRTVGLRASCLPLSKPFLSLSHSGWFSPRLGLGLHQRMLLCSGHCLVLIAETKAGLLTRQPGFCISECKSLDE